MTHFQTRLNETLFLKELATYRVRTRDWEDGDELQIDTVNSDDPYWPIEGRVNGVARSWTANGHFWDDETEAGYDLVLEPIPTPDHANA